MDQIITLLNESRVFWGLTTIVVNMGSRYAMAEISKFQEAVLKTDYGKSMVIFCMFFMGSRDVITSLILTIAFMIVVETWLNEKSKYNLLPRTITEKFLVATPAADSLK